MRDQDRTPWWNAPDEFRQMQEVLTQASYTRAALKTLGQMTPAADPLTAAVQRRQTAGGTPRETLVRLFASMACRSAQKRRSRRCRR